MEGTWRRPHQEASIPAHAPLSFLGDGEEGARFQGWVVRDDQNPRSTPGHPPWDTDGLLRLLMHFIPFYKILTLFLAGHHVAIIDT